MLLGRFAVCACDVSRVEVGSSLGEAGMFVLHSDLTFRSSSVPMRGSWALVQSQIDGATIQ